MENYLVLIDWKIIIAAMFLPPKIIYRFDAVLLKVPMASFAEIEKVILKFVWNFVRHQIAKAIPRKRSKARGIIVPDFKLCYIVLVIRWSDE